MLKKSSSSGSRPYYQRRSTDPFANIRRNHRIRAPQIRVIGPDGSQAGVMTSDQGIKLAAQYGLDLVEVAPSANPPVCRILDFGKYVYEESKKTKSSKGGASKIKEIELTPRIDIHDLQTKLRHAEEFLFHGNKVKMKLKFRGREMAHTDIGFEIMKKALAELELIGHPDSDARLNGRNIIVMLSPLPANKRKLKFNPDLLEQEKAKIAAEKKKAKEAAAAAHRDAAATPTPEA